MNGVHVCVCMYDDKAKKKKKRRFYFQYSVFSVHSVNNITVRKTSKEAEREGVCVCVCCVGGDGDGTVCIVQVGRVSESPSLFFLSLSVFLSFFLSFFSLQQCNSATVRVCVCVCVCVCACSIGSCGWGEGDVRLHYWACLRDVVA